MISNNIISKDVRVDIIANHSFATHLRKDLLGGSATDVCMVVFVHVVRLKGQLRLRTHSLNVEIEKYNG